MRYQIQVSLVLLSTMLVVSGCANDLKVTNNPRVPAHTVGSFNFLLENGKSSLVVFDEKGNRVTPEQKPLPPNAKLKSEATIKFYQVNPCYAEICYPGKPCETVLISPGPCPSGF